MSCGYGTLQPWRLLPLACAAVFWCHAALHAETPRTWKDASGRFRVEASFVAHEDGVVQLRKTDGTTISVPWEKLSSSDRRFVLARDDNEPATTESSANRASTPSTVAVGKTTAKREKFRSESLYGINWYKPQDIGNVAGVGQKSQKPVMFFRVLGDLDGFM